MATSVVDEVLRDLARAFHGRKVPRVRALHVPPSPWTGTKDGEFVAIELDSGALGLGYALLDDALGRLARGDRERWRDMDALAAASCWRSDDAAERAAGFAAANALTREVFDRSGYAPPLAEDSLGGLAPRHGEHIGMIGFFPPLVRQVRACGARLTVLELKMAHDAEDYRITNDPRDLESCDKVLSTSTVLLNDSLDALLHHCRRARAFALIGPGASCMPDALFRRGVTVLGGVWIADAERFKFALPRGMAWGESARKFALSRDDYPGLDALLAPAAPSS